MVQRDLLRLKYDRMQVERAEQNVVEAEYHVGCVRLAVRKSGYYTELACSEPEDCRRPSASGERAMNRKFYLGYFSYC